MIKTPMEIFMLRESKFRDIPEDPKIQEELAKYSAEYSTKDEPKPISDTRIYNILGKGSRDVFFRRKT